MKFALIFMLFTSSAFAKISSSEFGSSWKNLKITNESFYSRFSLKGEIFLLDSSGKKLNGPISEFREWRPSAKSHKIEAHWRVMADGFKVIAMRAEWQLKDDNSIDTLIQQYDDMTEDGGKDIKFGKLIREERKVLENFAPVTWVAETTSNARVILRFTPDIENYRESGVIDKLTIGGDRNSFTVMDNQGYLWGAYVRFGGILSGMTSHRGSFVISYYPFKGAKEVGTAQGKEIELTFSEDLRVRIINDADLIPGETRVKVYGKYVPHVKSPSVGSVSSFGQETLAGVDKELR